MKIKTNRKVRYAVVHSSGTKPSLNISPVDIDRWHKARGWTGIGYHYVITRDGKLHTGRSLDKIGAHVAGHNTGSIGICLVGGLGRDLNPAPAFTKAQWRTLKKWCAEILEIYEGITILGHRDLAPTACPSFDVAHWLATEEVQP